MTNVKTHLMFQGDATDAISLYKSVFSDFSVERMETYRQDDDGEEGTIKEARISFAGHRLIVIDSPTEHDFDFTPSVSLHVDFDKSDAMEEAFAMLSDGGEVLMPPDNYGFSERFAWTKDKFGVSWQLNLS